jgi:uroporphyrinogen decarboxylase
MRDDLQALCLCHPLLFPDFRAGDVDFDKGMGDDHVPEIVDDWGCKRVYPIRGISGPVVGHPLTDWGALETWQPPEPRVDPERLAEMERQRAKGEVVTFHAEHGFLFMRLFYLRGFDNFALDIATQDPRLDELIEIITSYWERAFAPYIAAGADQLVAGDDLGAQTASILGPKHFRRFLLPSYQRLFAPARASGAHVFLHHDGYVMDIMDEIIETGVSIVNPQDLVNGIDNLAREVKGRVCICIDIDRQTVLPYGSPGDVHELVKEEVLKLGSPQGGLQMVCGVYPPTPLENVEALCAALEEYRTYWAGRPS